MNILAIAFVSVILALSVGVLLFIYFRRNEWFKKAFTLVVASTVICSGGIFMSFGDENPPFEPPVENTTYGGFIYPELYDPFLYYKNDTGVWLPINRTIVPKSLTVAGRDYSYGVTDGWYSAFFRSQSSDVKDRPVALQNGSYTLSLSPADYVVYYPKKYAAQGRVGNRVQSDVVINGYNATYPGFYDKIGVAGDFADLVFSYEVEDLKEKMVVSDKAYLQSRFASQCNPGDYSIVNLVYSTVIRAYRGDDVNGNTAGIVYGGDRTSFKGFGVFENRTLTISDELYFIDEYNSTVFFIPRLYAYDSAGHTILLNKTLTMTSFGNLVVAVSVPYWWLDGVAVYPVTIDPPVYGVIEDLTISSYEFDIQEGLYTDAVRVGYDSTYTYFAVVCTGDTGTENDGYVRTIKVYNNNGTIVKAVVDSLEYDTSDGYQPCIVNIVDNTTDPMQGSNFYAITYFDAGSLLQKVVTVKISNEGVMGASVNDTLSLSYEAAPAGRSMSRITNIPNTGRYAVVYSDKAESLVMETIAINKTGVINKVILDSVVIDDSGIFPSIDWVDDDTLAVAYDSGSSDGRDGYLATWNISSTGDITATYADFWEFDTTDCRGPALYNLPDPGIGAGYEYFALTYMRTNQSVFTLRINSTGSIWKTWVDALYRISSTGNYSTLFGIGYNSTQSSYIMGVSYQGDSGDGYVSVFDVNASGYIGSHIDYIEFDQVDTLWYSPCLQCNGNNNWFIPYAGTSNDGWSKTIRIYMPIQSFDIRYLKTGYTTNAYGMTEDDTYIYQLTSSRTFKQIWKTNMTVRKTSAAYSSSGNIYGSANDDTYVYIGGGGANCSVKRYWKTNLTLKDFTTPMGGANTIRDIEVDDTYIYAAGSGGNLSVKRWWKSNMSYAGCTANYTQSIYAIEIDDPYLYIGGMLYKVYKYWLSNLTKTSTEATYEGAGIYALAQDDTYIYVCGNAGLSTSFVVEQRWKTNLTRRAMTLSYTALLYDVHVYDDYVYAGGSTINLVYQYWVSNMTKRAQTPSFGDTIRAIESDMYFLYVTGGGGNIVQYWKTNLTPTTGLISPVNGSTGVSLYPRCSIWANASYWLPLTVKWYTNESGSWVLKATYTGNVTGLERTNYTFSDFDTNNTKYWWRVLLNDSFGRSDNDTFHFTTQLGGGGGGVTYTAQVRNYGLDYFVWLGENMTAYWVNKTISNMNEATESIAIWNRSSWSSADGLWQTYNGTRTGVNFTVHTFDIIRIIMDDAVGNQTISMDENPDVNYTNSKSIKLVNTTVNKGYNFSGWNRNTPGGTTLEAINSSNIGLDNGDMVARWNRTIFDWDIWISYFGPQDYAVAQWNVIQTKVSTLKFFDT